MLEGFLQREPAKRIGCKKINLIEWNEIKNMKWFNNFEKLQGAVNLSLGETNDWLEDANLEFDPHYHVIFLSYIN